MEVSKVNYTTIAQFIDHLKLKNDVVGIVEYGGRTFSDIDEHFLLLQNIAQYIAKDIGGLWKEDEVIYHLNTDTAEAQEKDAVVDLLFGD